MIIPALSKFYPNKMPETDCCCHVLPVQIMYHALCPPSYVFPDRGNCQVFNSVDFTHLCSYKWRGFSVDDSDIFRCCGMGWTIKKRWLRLGDLIFKEAERGISSSRRKALHNKIWRHTLNFCWHAVVFRFCHTDVCPLRLRAQRGKGASKANRALYMCCLAPGWQWFDGWAGWRQLAIPKPCREDQEEGRWCHWSEIQCSQFSMFFGVHV